MLKLFSNWLFKFRRSIIDFLVSNSTALLIFSLLLVVGGTFLKLAYVLQADSVSQAIVANVATDALFAVFMIFGVTSIESHRRKRENKIFNKSVYDDLKIDLKKTMLKLLIEFGRADKDALIRTNFHYAIDGEIYSAFHDLIKHPDEYDGFIAGLQQKRRQDINKILRVRGVVDEGMHAVEIISRKLKPGVQNIRVREQYNLWEIEDPSDYEKYLISGKKYGIRYINKDGYFSGHVKTEVYAVEWSDTLREFKGYLMRNMQYICDVYDLCDRENL
jgi:hypothetical protein